VTGVNDVTPGSLDMVILSSHAFEREMAAEMRRRHPELPFIAIYNPHLSHFPPDRKVDETTLLPHDYEDFRCLSAAQWIDIFRPDLLICTHFIYFRALLQASHRPKYLIYYCFELPGGSCGYELESRHWEEHNSLRERIDLAIFPEKHRRDYYCDLFDFGSVPSAVIYNARPLSATAPVRASERNGRILVQGALSFRQNHMDYLVRRRRPIPHVDVYGLLQDHDPTKDILTNPDIAKRHGFSYCGFLDNTSLALRRRYYSYLYVAWKPLSFDTLYACPNKFFESIGDGVPPIVAPHPQCREIVEKYDCGILLQDWSLTSFERGLEEAEEVFRSTRYDQLVANCRQAHEEELCWERQFELLRPFLPARAEQVSVRRGERRKKFALLDPSLSNETGHFYPYARHVLGGARRLGFENVVGTNRRLEVDLEDVDRLYPVYWRDYWGRDLSLPHRPKREDSSRLFVKHTKFILEREQFQAEDHIFIPNISDFDLAQLAIYLVSELDPEAPTWHVFLRRDVPEDNWTRVHSLRVLGKAIDRGKVRLYTDTTELAEQHRALTGFSVTVLPIPISTQPLVPSLAGADAPLRVVYLGDARVEKGFPRIPDLVRATETLTQRGDLSYSIQTYNGGSEPACQQAAAELTALDLGPEGELLEDRLSSRKYAELLSKSDVVLALYDRDAYKRRSSHVVVEALCSGKVVLITPGTAPASLIEADSQWLCSSVEIAAARIGELVDLRKRGVSYLGLPEDRRAHLADFHCGLRLVEILVGEAGQSSVCTSGTEAEQTADSAISFRGTAE